MSWRCDCVRITSAALPAVLPFSTRIDRDEITPKILATPLPDTRYLGATPHPVENAQGRPDPRSNFW